MTVYRVGEGQSPSGIILDRYTKWFTKFEDAFEYAKKTRKNIYVSKKQQKIF